MNQKLVEHRPEKFYIYLVGEETPITINRQQRDRLLDFMDQGKKFFVVGEYILMINSIKYVKPEKISVIKQIKTKPVFDDEGKLVKFKEV